MLQKRWQFLQVVLEGKAFHASWRLTTPFVAWELGKGHGDSKSAGHLLNIRTGYWEFCCTVGGSPKMADWMGKEKGWGWKQKPLRWFLFFSLWPRKESGYLCVLTSKTKAFESNVGISQSFLPVLLEISCLDIITNLFMFAKDYLWILLGQNSNRDSVNLKKNNSWRPGKKKKKPLWIQVLLFLQM